MADIDSLPCSPRLSHSLTVMWRETKGRISRSSRSRCSKSASANCSSTRASCSPRTAEAFDRHSVDERIDLVGVLVDAAVLGLHRLHQPGGGCGALEQQGPEELVLTGVVHVQAPEDEPQGVRDDDGTGGVTVGDAADQRGEGDELTSEHPVDHEHLVDVGLLGGLDGGGHGDTSRSGVGVSHQPRSPRRHRPPTAPPRHLHTRGGGSQLTTACRTVASATTPRRPVQREPPRRRRRTTSARDLNVLVAETGRRAATCAAMTAGDWGSFAGRAPSVGVS